MPWSREVAEDEKWSAYGYTLKNSTGQIYYLLLDWMWCIVQTNVSPQNSYFEMLTPNVIAVRGEAFGRPLVGLW